MRCLKAWRLSKRVEEDPISFLLFGKRFWRSIINWDALAGAGTISADDLELFELFETADQAIAEIKNWRV